MGVSRGGKKNALFLGEGDRKGGVGTTARRGGGWPVGWGAQTDHAVIWPLYSMTSSARARIVCGTVRPSAFAVFRLITSSNLVGSITGNSAGLAPLSTLPA